MNILSYGHKVRTNRVSTKRVVTSISAFFLEDGTATSPTKREAKLLDTLVKIGSLPETVRYVLHAIHANLGQHY